MKNICIVGGGIAGSELVLQLASKGVEVTLIEPRLDKNSSFNNNVHKTAMLAELVCSNSLRGTGLHSAPGLLKEELKILSSFLINLATMHTVPAGTALAVDRTAFSAAVTKSVLENPYITVISRTIEDINELLAEYKYVVLATGPLTQGGLATQLRELSGTEYMYFYDAIAPIVAADSIDMEKCFRASRYGKGEGDDYINAPMSRELYYRFVQELKDGKKAALHEGDEGIFFRGCMPVEVIASESDDALLFGPMRADGLFEKTKTERPYAVVQLRQDNLCASMYNMVGFQTRLTYGEQDRIFRKIPGLENVEFLRHGSMHRNTFVNAPLVLNEDMSLKSNSRVFLAGQISGVEGYIESMAHGCYVCRVLLKKLGMLDSFELPVTTAIGSLINYLLKADPDNFQPVKMNFGLLPPIPKGDKRIKKNEIKLEQSKRALQALSAVI
jgi:methylenetetrahydrofolate--tRNA-(uracil-5-)-methyltransferase